MPVNNFTIIFGYIRKAISAMCRLLLRLFANFNEIPVIKLMIIFSGYFGLSHI